MPPKKRTTRGKPFTVAVPHVPPVERKGEHWWMEADGHELRLSNLDKIFWPEEGYTKGDLIAYYYNVATLMLPYIAERPLTMKRMPDGINGPHFYEKNAPSHTPDWMPKCRVGNFEGPTRWGQSEPGEYNDFLMADDAAALVFVANLGCIEFHPLHSRCATVELPDYLFFDLDPFEPATFDDVLAVAHHVRAALDVLGLPCYPKTSGATGMQIYVPLQLGPSYDVARGFVEVVARHIHGADRERVTMEWQVSKRAGKVFIDHNMNRRGANIAAVYCVRPELGATVSTPLTWEEVEKGVHPSDFTIVNVHERFASIPDPFRGMIENPVDLRPALEKLGLPADFDVAEPNPGDEDRLATYERKRRFAQTPEPPPRVASPGGNSFVIQKHNATRLHYDLRLERNGVLVSWALPKGLPARHGVRHLAVQTEDHPLEYGGFEGWIPEGNYGAGEVRIYDRGTYDALEWEDGRKVSFRLHGERHQGEWHLVKTSGRDWLILLAKRSPELPDPPRFVPMLAELWKEPFDDPKWRFEPKLDGIRTLAYVATDATRLVSRTGRDQTAIYPELGNLALYVNAASAVIDGEIVSFDSSGRPSFERLQQRMNLSSPADVAKARKQYPVRLIVFDLLWLDARDLTREPLEERRKLLEDIVTGSDHMEVAFYREGEGRALFEAAEQLGLEGVVAKKLGSHYLPGKRSRDWRKIKATRTQDCVIIGWTLGSGSRSATLGALLLGAYADGELVWIGQAGTGLTQSMLADVYRKLEEHETDRPPIDEPELRKIKGARWVRPELVCEVEYLELTKARKLRAPSFKGLRPDKAPEDCVLEAPAE